MSEWHVDRLDLADHLPRDALDGETPVAEVQVREDLSAESRTIVASYLRGLADGIEPNSLQSSLED
jgi:hypothetical protein